MKKVLLLVALLGIITAFSGMFIFNDTGVFLTGVLVTIAGYIGAIGYDKYKK